MTMTQYELISTCKSHIGDNLLHFSDSLKIVKLALLTSVILIHLNAVSIAQQKTVFHYQAYVSDYLGSTTPSVV